MYQDNTKNRKGKIAWQDKSYYIKLIALCNKALDKWWNLSGPESDYECSFYFKALAKAALDLKESEAL